MDIDPIHSQSIDCECPPLEIPIRQGDILVRYQNKIANFDALRVVINADCDLAQGKTEGIILALDLVNLRQFIEIYWAQKKLDQQFQKIIGECSEAIEKVRKKENPAAKKISQKRLQEWLKEAPTNNILKAIIGNLSLDTRSIEEVINKTKELLEIYQRVNQNSFEKFIAINHIGRLTDISQTKNEQLNRAKNELAKFPDDNFFIAEIPGINKLGFVVRMRAMDSIPFPSVTTDFQVAKTSDQDIYCRIARLKPAYKYCLSQNFALLYSRVGLPDDHKIAHKMALENLLT